MHGHAATEHAPKGNASPRIILTDTELLTGEDSKKIAYDFLPDPDQ
jgi:hypothetical protein